MLAQPQVFENLIQNLPLRAARKIFRRFAFLNAVCEKICCGILLRATSHSCTHDTDTESQTRLVTVHTAPHVTPQHFLQYRFGTGLVGTGAIGADVTSDATAPPARRPGGYSERRAYWRGNEPARQGGLVGWQGLLEAEMTERRQGGSGAGTKHKSSKISQKFASVKRDLPKENLP